jgi:two-component system osmolarity sensor histidine kinase EnvZ
MSRAGRLAWPRSLFARNVALLVVLAVIGQAGSLAVLLHFVQRPRIERAAETFALYVKTLDTLLSALPPEARERVGAPLLASRDLPPGADAAPPAPGLRNFYRTYQRDVFVDALRRSLPAELLVRWESSVANEQRLWIRAHLGPEPYWIALPVPDAANNQGMASALLLSLALGVLAIAAAFVIQRHINQPLRDLADAARGLGTGDAPEALRVDGPTEIAQVSVAFNDMLSALRDADATRSLMLAGISHDIRTPLTKLRLAVAMTSASAENTALAASTDHYLDQIDAILQQFMDYAGAGTREVPEMADLNALVESLVADFAGLGHVFDVSLGNLPPFAYRPISVLRILMNLMQNAVLYGRVGLAVRTWDDGAGFVHVEVADRGTESAGGDDLDALKAPFRRGRSEHAQPGGTGLGLAIVDRIAKLHGGGLQLSRREGGGFSAVVTLRTDR